MSEDELFKGRRRKKKGKEEKKKKLETEVGYALTWRRSGPAPRRSIIQSFGASAAALTADTEHLPMLLQDVRWHASGRRRGPLLQMYLVSV